MRKLGSPDAHRATLATDLLSRDEIRALVAASNAAGFAAVLTSWGIIAATFALLARFPHPLTFVAAVVVLGGRQLALAILMHDASHGSLFRTRWLNEVFADWVCAKPVWNDVARYRRHHLAHHAHTGTELDPDRCLAAAFPVTRASLARKLLRDALGVTGLKRIVGLCAMDLELIAYTVTPEIRRLPRRPIHEHLAAGARNLVGVVVTNLALAAVLAATGHAWLYAAWAVAFVTSFGVVVRIRSIAEHACTAASADPLRNTRTTIAGPLARLLVAPHRVSYHLEHHLLMTVPYFRLPAMHALLVARGALPEGAVARGYLGVLRLAANVRQ
jgi:fatty acid desaturase